MCHKTPPRFAGCFFRIDASPHAGLDTEGGRDARFNTSVVVAVPNAELAPLLDHASVAKSKCQETPVVDGFWDWSGTHSSLTLAALQPLPYGIANIFLLKASGRFWNGKTNVLISSLPHLFCAVLVSFLLMYRIHLGVCRVMAHRENVQRMYVPYHRYPMLKVLG